MFCFRNTSHVIILYGTVSFKCRLIYENIYAYTVKRQRGKFPWDLYWENKTYKLKRFIVLCFRHTMKLMWLDFLTYAELLSCVSIVNYKEVVGGGGWQLPLILPLFGFPLSPQLRNLSTKFENCSEHAWNGLRTTTTSSFSQRFDSEKWILNHDKWSPLWTVYTSRLLMSKRSITKGHRNLFLMFRRRKT